MFALVGPVVRREEPPEELMVGRERPTGEVVLIAGGDGEANADARPSDRGILLPDAPSLLSAPLRPGALSRATDETV